jgi:3-oxo-5alpha-steroid 4-dehydrogenase
MGGGTPLQKACGFEDSPDEMFKYLMASSGPGAHRDKIRLYCDRSVEHYEWLTSRGVPFKLSFVPPSIAMNPPSDDGLTYTGSELAHPYCTIALPAPRGHNVQHEGDSGAVLMEALLAEVSRVGAVVQTDSRAEALIADRSGRIVGVVVDHAGRELCIRASRGVIVCTGGFGSNRQLVALHSPLFSDCLPVGPDTNDGSGLLLCTAAGGHAILMDATFVAIPFAKPRQLIKGILVDAHGRRYINEDVYQAVHGNVAMRQQNGEVYLIVDAAVFARPDYPTEIAAVADSPEELEARLGFPVGSLTATLASYNEHAGKGEDPLFHKQAEWLTPLAQPPFTAFDLRRSTSPYPFFTLGGIHTSVHGEVLTPDGSVIRGLYAAGRTTSGLCAHGYSSGVSLADATFFGRLAGLRASRDGQATEGPRTTG